MSHEIKPIRYQRRNINITLKTLARCTYLISLIKAQRKMSDDLWWIFFLLILMMTSKVFLLGTQGTALCHPHTEKYQTSQLFHWLKQPSVLYTCSGPWPYNLFFPVLFLFDWGGGWGGYGQLSKVLKVVCWAGSVPFPPVSLQRQVVYCCGQCSSRGRAYTVSWLVGVQIKVTL